jgi:hypothetical protein
MKKTKEIKYDDALDTVETILGVNIVLLSNALHNIKDIETQEVYIKIRKGISALILNNLGFKKGIEKG